MLQPANKLSAARSVEQVAREIDRKSDIHPGHHWVFDHFPGYDGLLKAGLHVDYLGTFASPHFAGLHSLVKDTIVKIALPVVDEEYHELTDLLEAVHDAGPEFTFVDLGAGYGRWSARAGVAARSKGRKVKVILVEGEPRHVEFAHENMAMNGLSPDEYTIFDGAIALADGREFYNVQLPADWPGWHRGDPSIWYGQSLISSGNFGKVEPTDEQYLGRPLFRTENGYGAVEIKTFSLSTVLAGLGFVDLIDMDIQGAEGMLVQGNVPLLSEQVRRLHIETHSTDVEEQIRAALTGTEWICLRDYPHTAISETPFGTVDFQGGVQTWINPKLY